MLEIKKEFKDLIPALTAEEFKQLEDNCLAEGIREKILTWNGTIIDGHNRYEIATKWNLDYQTESKFIKVWICSSVSVSYTECKSSLKPTGSFR